MFVAYPYILVTMCLAMVYSHSVRLGYTSLPNSSNFKSTFLNVFLFYPSSLVVSLLFLPLLPLSLLLKCCGIHSMDNRAEDSLQVLPEKLDSSSSEMFFRTEGGVLFTLDIEPTSTVLTTIEVVQESLGFDFVRRKVHLGFNGELLDERESTRLNQYDLASGDVVDVLVEPTTVDIRLRQESGPVLAIKLSGEAALADLMDAVEAKTKILATNQWLLLNDNPVSVNLDTRLGILALTESQQGPMQMAVFELVITVDVELPGGDGAVLTTQIRRDETVSRLVQAVAEERRLDVGEIEIAKQGQPGPLALELTVHAAGLKTGTILILTQFVNLSVELPNETTSSFRMDAFVPVRSLFDEFEQREGVQREDQFLLTISGERVDRRQDVLLKDLEATSFRLLHARIGLILRLPSRETQRIDARRDMSCAELVAAVAKTQTAKVEDVELDFEGTALGPPTATLHESGLSDGSELVVTRYITVVVRLEDGSHLDLRIQAGETIRDLKRVLGKRTPLAVDDQCLMSNGETMRNSMTLDNPVELSLVPVTLELEVTGSGEVSLRRDATGDELYEAVAKLQRAEVNEVRVYVDGRMVERLQRLDAQGVRSGMKVDAKVMMKLAVFVVSRGETVNVELPRGAKIKDVKAALEEVLKPVPQSRMLVKGRGKEQFLRDGKAVTKDLRNGVEVFDAEITVRIETGQEAFGSAKEYTVTVRRDARAVELETKLLAMAKGVGKANYNAAELSVNGEVLDLSRLLHEQGVEDGTKVVATLKVLSKKEKRERRARLRKQRRGTDALKRTIEQYEARIAFLMKKAKKSMREGQKKKALLYLKEIQKLQSAILSLEEHLIAIQSQTLSTDVVASQLSQRAQSEAMKRVNFERLDQLQYEKKSAIRDAEEINELLGEMGDDKEKDDGIEQEEEEMLLELLEDDLVNAPVQRKFIYSYFKCY